LKDKTGHKICFQCDYEITPKDNGLCINQGTIHEIYQCNDCHFSEFGFNINGQLLVFNKINDESGQKTGDKI